MLKPKKGSKKCYWCGKHACRNLWDSWYVRLYEKITCEACEIWDREQRWAGYPGLQKPKDGVYQMVLVIGAIPP